MSADSHPTNSVDRMLGLWRYNSEVALQAKGEQVHARSDLIERLSGYLGKTVAVSGFPSFKLFTVLETGIGRDKKVFLPSYSSNVPESERREVVVGQGELLEVMDTGSIRVRTEDSGYIFPVEDITTFSVLPKAE